MMRPIVKKTKNHFNIPYLWTSVDRDTEKTIKEEFHQFSKHNKIKLWNQHGDKYKNRDFLGDLVYSDIIPQEKSWSDPPSGSSLKYSSNINFNDVLYKSTYVRLNDSILSSSILRLVHNGISERGGFLYFTDRLDKCLVYDYSLPHRSKNAVKIKSLIDIPKPDHLYDIGSAIERSTEETRAALKNALVYGHKIVGHRNTMVHIDRRRDETTAGPFIDTLILNEMLHKYIYEYNYYDSKNKILFDKVFEIGCGSGLLLSSCVQNMPGIMQVMAIDPLMAAIHCTYRNVCANRLISSHKDQQLYFVCGFFEPELFNGYDAVFCNPPYIPLEPTQEDYYRIDAISGTSLLKKVIQSSSTLLNNCGFLFMIYSTLSQEEFNESVEKAGVEFENLGPLVIVHK